jgi:hypothetical protein
MQEIGLETSGSVSDGELYSKVHGRFLCPATDGKFVSIHCLTSYSILFEIRIADSLQITFNRRKRTLNEQSQIIHCRYDSCLDLFDVCKAGSSLN